MDSDIKKMLEINVEQKKYYEKATGAEESEVNGTATNLYRRIRKRAFRALHKADVPSYINDLHRTWIGDVSNSKVLDLGVGSGNPLSEELAKNAKFYLANDLSQSRLDELKVKLENQGIIGANFHVGDFLNPDFKEKNFNTVYAMAVLHHFEHPEAFLKVLHNKLADNGVVVTVDPIETWIPAKLIRMIYRPFQTDSKWEFPFTNKTLAAIEKYFVIEDIQGMYGRSKWAMPLSIINPETAEKKAVQWHEKDMKKAKTLSEIKSCLQVSFKLCKR